MRNDCKEFHCTSIAAPIPKCFGIGGLFIACALLPFVPMYIGIAEGIQLFVSPTGDDSNPGTKKVPFATMARAKEAARKFAGKQPVTIRFAPGTYRIEKTVTFTAEDSGSEAAPVRYVADKSWKSTLAGFKTLNLTWKEGKEGVFSAKVPEGLLFDHLYVNGDKMIRARYPNADPANGFWDAAYRDQENAGTLTDIRKHLASMSDPVGAYVHGYHGLGWGSLHFLITRKVEKYVLECGKEHNAEGGYQNAGRRTAPYAPMAKMGFVENAREELDAFDEWFLDEKSATLFFKPGKSLNLENARFEVVVCERLIELKGDESTPVKFVSFEGFRITGTRYTFMDTKVVPSGGDWRVARTGSIYMEATEDCSVVDCFFDHVGGNAVYIFGYNQRARVTDCLMEYTGASGVVIEGDNSSLRSPWAHRWGWPEEEVGPLPEGEFEEGLNAKEGVHSLAEMTDSALDGSQCISGLIDIEPGPANRHYPAQCVVENNLMRELGTVEKQISGVFISKAFEIAVRRNTIYNVPRAAVNVNDDCWGGHVFEKNSMFNTCIESREHGCYNSWGRDRYWIKNGRNSNDSVAKKMRRFALLDTLSPIVLRNNFFQCDHGYDIDLDDGSTHYEIYNNLCPSGGIKIREGFDRKVFNNISTTFSPHCTLKYNGDVVRGNILIGPQPYTPKGDKKVKADTLGPNLVIIKNADASYDPKVVIADAGFKNMNKGDFRLAKDSPAYEIGFKDFDTALDSFGESNPKLKTMAEKGIKQRCHTQAIVEKR